MVRYPLLLPFVFAAATALAQTAPVITADDMPVPGDSLRLSLAATLPANAPALALNGANRTWNYAGLVPVTQRVERYNSFASSASGLQLVVFGPLSTANRANLATPRNLAIGGAALPAGDGKEFFNLSTSEFRSVGFGVTLNGVALAIPYVAQDVIYHFPQAYTGSDLSNSYFEASVPGTGFLSRKRKRTNQPDAWGTLTTPYGTFQTLRVVTTLLDHDSVAVGGAPGQGATLPLTREYKWLAKAQHVPLLTITTQQLAGREVVTGVEYRDIYRRIVALAARDAATAAALTAYPNPSAVGSALALAVPAGGGPLTVSATDLVGRPLFRRGFAGSAGTVSVGAEAFGTFRGVALLTVTTSRGTATRRVVRE